MGYCSATQRASGPASITTRGSSLDGLNTDSGGRSVGGSKVVSSSSAVLIRSSRNSRSSSARWHQAAAYHWPWSLVTRYGSMTRWVWVSRP